MWDLELLKENNGSLIIGTPLKMRFVFLGITLFLVYMILFYSLYAIVPIFLVICSICGTLYNEKWIFDREQKAASHAEGFTLFTRKKIYHFSRITRVELRNSKPKSALQNAEPEGEPDQDAVETNHSKVKPRGFSALFLIFEDGKELNMHTTNIKKAHEQQKLGKLVSEFCNKPFYSSS